MMKRIEQLVGLCVLAATTAAWAQAPKSGPSQPNTILTVEQPDAQRTKDEFSSLLDRYPPSLRGVLTLDPNLLANDSYLAPYPALVSYLSAHPEIARNPAFYAGEFSPR